MKHLIVAGIAIGILYWLTRPAVAAPATPTNPVGANPPTALNNAAPRTTNIGQLDLAGSSFARKVPGVASVS